MANGRAPRDRRNLVESAVQASVRTLLDWRRWWLSLLFALVLVIVGVTVAVLVNPSATAPNLPLSEEDVGRVATADVRAPMSFTVPDIEATDRRRQEAEEEVRSTYDFEQEMGAERIRRLRDAFGNMQQLVREIDEALSQLPPEEAESLPGEEGPGAKKKPRPRKRPAPKPPGVGEEAPAAEELSERAQLAQQLEAGFDERKAQFLQTLQVVVKEEDFAHLKRDRFSPATLASLTNLVERTMRHMIVPSRELLGADRGRGITVRFLREGTPERELVVASFTRILDMEEALLRVEQTAALELSDVDGPLRASEIRVAKALVAPNMFFNRAETERRRREARDNVQVLEIRIKKGAKIIRDGDLIEMRHVRVFQEMQKLTEVSNAGELAVGTVLLVVVLLLVFIRFSIRNIRKFRHQPRDLGLLALVLFAFIVSVKVWFWIFGAVWEQFRIFPLESYYYAIPFAAGAMLIRFVLNSEMALAFAAAAAVLAGMLMENSLVYGTYCLVTSIVGAGAVVNVKQRSSLLRAGSSTGIANAGLAIVLSLIGGEFWSFQTVFNAVFAFSGGILAAVVVTGVAPVIEVVFGYTTDIKLLELANLNHPLLKDLIVQAPGSYHHSIIVGSLVEAAAESIHCNPLLARVMAYYHDIGKIKNPSYFSENQRDGVNRHDKLKPSLSGTVLKAHVKDGAELARASRLGGPIVDAITQHHGTSLIKFFYQRAKDQAEEGETVNEADFRYPGPKPQSREVALVLLADSVEAAAKSISEPSPARLQGLVQTIINRIFVDGQLDECDLTLKDLHEIARAFNRVLTGIYHHRPDYPEAATKEREAGERKPKSLDKIPVVKKEPPPEARREPAEPSSPGDIKRLGQ